MDHRQYHRHMLVANFDMDRAAEVSHLLVKWGVEAFYFVPGQAAHVFRCVAQSRSMLPASYFSSFWVRTLEVFDKHIEKHVQIPLVLW